MTLEALYEKTEKRLGEHYSIDKFFDKLDAKIGNCELTQAIINEVEGMDVEDMTECTFPGVDGHYDSEDDYYEAVDEEAEVNFNIRFREHLWELGK